jgi:large subunit ribosomal protein L34
LRKKCGLTFKKKNYTIKNMSITFHPKKKKRKRTHGFLKRKRTKAGKKILRRRRKKGRWRLTV